MRRIASTSDLHAYAHVSTSTCMNACANHTHMHTHAHIPTHTILKRIDVILSAGLER